MPSQTSPQTAPQPAIVPLYPEQLREFAAKAGEPDYLLVDVRQPGEYLEGHIPGARLLPLPELEQSLDQLRGKASLIFYCRSGVRSLSASNLARAALSPEIRIANLMGGFMAWEGRFLTDMPRLELFIPDGDTAQGQNGQDATQVLLRAMDLEKAAELFYLAAAAKARIPEMAEALAKLVKVEQAHARVIFHRLQQVDAGYAGMDFTTCHAGLKGDILEGGMSLEEAVNRLDTAAGQDGAHDEFCLGITELALQIELAAYDLYKNLAGLHARTELEPVFLELARDELNHQRVLAGLLPRCAT